MMSSMIPGVQLIDRELLDRTIEDARRSPRLRKNYNFHASDDDNPHRFLNVICRGSYCAPHRHVSPPKPESFLVLSGALRLVIFEDDGTPAVWYRLGEGGIFGIDVAPGLWHTVLALSDVAVCYEVKPGPYVPLSDKDFAPWAPREGAPHVGSYLDGLQRLAETTP
ncbi:MAG: WbuC family cupin fold metalloprotein [Polyangiaceae bacterium]